MAPLEVHWNNLSATLQTEILYNMSTGKKQDWPKIISKLQLTTKEEEDAIKHIRRRISQDEAEEKFLRKQQRRRRDYLLGRNKSTASATAPASGSQECPPALPPLSERRKLPKSEYYLCTKKELLTARNFLRSRQLNPKLAGDWGISSDEIDREDDDDTPVPSILPKDDFGFEVTPAVNLKSVTGKTSTREGEDGTGGKNSPVEFLNSFAREPTKGKSHKRQMQVPLLPLLNSAYEYRRDKHMRSLREMRGRMDFTLQQIPGPVLSPVERAQEVRLTVNDMGAADIESSSPYDVLPLPSSPPSMDQLAETEESPSPHDALAMRTIPLLGSEASDNRPSSSTAGESTSERISGDDISVKPALPSTDSTRRKFGTRQETPTPTGTTNTTTSSEKRSKKGRRRRDEETGKKKVVVPSSQVTPTSKTFRPVIEIPAVRAHMVSRKVATERSAQMSLTDNIADQPSKIQTRRHKSVVTFAEGEEARSTETPTSSREEDVFDSVPNRSIKKSHTHVPRSREGTAAEAAMTMKRKQRSTVVSARPYSLRSDSSSELATVNKIEEAAKSRDKATESIDTPRMVTRRTTRRRSGLRKSD